MPSQCVVIARSKLELGRSRAKGGHTEEEESTREDAPGVLTLLDGLLGGSSLLRTPSPGPEGVADEPAISAAASTGDHVLSSGKRGFQFLRFSGPRWRKEEIAGESASCEERKKRDVLASLSKLRLREVRTWQLAGGLDAPFQNSEQSEDGQVCGSSDARHGDVAATPDSEDVGVKSLETSRRPIVIRAVSQAGGGPQPSLTAVRQSGWPFRVPLPVTLCATDDVRDSGACPEEEGGRTDGHLAALGSSSSVERDEAEYSHDSAVTSAECDPLDGSSMFDSCTSSSLASEYTGHSIDGDGRAFWLQKSSKLASSQTLPLGNVKLASLILATRVGSRLRLESPARADQHRQDLEEAQENEAGIRSEEGCSLGFLSPGSDRCRDVQVGVAGRPEEADSEQRSTWPLDPVSSSDTGYGQSLHHTGLCSTFEVSASTRGGSTLFLGAGTKKVDEQKAEASYGGAFEEERGSRRKGGKSFHFGDWMQMPLLPLNLTKEQEFVKRDENEDKETRTTAI